MGNSVIVVEHDEEAILAADHVVDMGPGAGEHGGLIVAQGTPEEICQNKQSLTGDYLTGRRSIPMPAKFAQARPGTHAANRRRKRQQSERRDAESAGRTDGVRHRRIRLRQIHADQRHAVSRRGATSVRQQHRARAVCRDQRPGIFRQGDQRRSKPDRTHAAFQSRHLHRPVHADPRTVRRCAVVARTRLRAGDASRSTSRAGAANPARATA